MSNTNKWLLPVLLVILLVTGYRYEIVPLLQKDKHLSEMIKRKPKRVIARNKHKPIDIAVPPSFIEKIYSFPTTKFVHQRKLNQITIEMNLSDYAAAARLLGLVLSSTELDSMDINITDKNKLYMSFKYKQSKYSAPPVSLKNILSICDGARGLVVGSGYPISMAKLIAIVEVSEKKSAWLLWPNGEVQVVSVGDQLLSGVGRVVKISNQLTIIKWRQKNIVLSLSG